MEADGALHSTQIVDEYTMLSFSQQATQRNAPEPLSVDPAPTVDHTWATLRRKGGKQEEFRLVDRVESNGTHTHSRYTLGRSRSCDVHVDHKCVSSRHCAIYCDFSQARMRVFLEDCSANGTFVNDLSTRVGRGERVELRSGDEIFLVNPRTVHAHTDGKGASSEEAEAALVAVFIFVNVRDRVAAHREIGFAPSLAPHNTASHTPSACVTPTPLSSSLSVAPQQQSQQQRRIEDFYVIGDKIGSGMCGQVYVCVERATRRRCAMKEIDLRRLARAPGLAIDDLREEARLMRELHHPNIIQVLDSFESPSALFVVMELVQGGDLFDRIVERGRYTESNARAVMLNALSAVQYMHRRNIIHRDLKPENILLVSPDDDVTLKVSDFGLAKRASAEGLRTFCGTPQYFAPEVLRRRDSVQGSGRYGAKADMWSLGVVLYIMLSGSFPFDEQSLFADIEAAHYDMSGPEWAAVSLSAKSFLRGLLALGERERMDADEALRHPWLCDAPARLPPPWTAQRERETLKETQRDKDTHPHKERQRDEAARPTIAIPKSVAFSQRAQSHTNANLKESPHKHSLFEDKSPQRERLAPAFLDIYSAADSPDERERDREIENEKEKEIEIEQVERRREKEEEERKQIERASKQLEKETEEPSKEQEKHEQKREENNQPLCREDEQLRIEREINDEGKGNKEKENDQGQQHEATECRSIAVHDAKSSSPSFSSAPAPAVLPLSPFLPPWPLPLGSYVAVEKEFSDDQITGFSDAENENACPSSSASATKKRNRHKSRKNESDAATMPTMSTPLTDSEQRSKKSRRKSSSASVVASSEEKKTAPSSVVHAQNAGGSDAKARGQRQQSLLAAWGLSPSPAKAHTPTRIRQREDDHTGSSQATREKEDATTSSSATNALSSGNKLRAKTNSLTTLFKNAHKINLTGNLND